MHTRTKKRLLVFEDGSDVKALSEIQLGQRRVLVEEESSPSSSSSFSPVKKENEQLRMSDHNENDRRVQQP